jgi:hypothetical protein
MSSRNPAMYCFVLLALGVTLAQFDVRSTAAAELTFTIPLATLDDVRRLDQRPEIAEVMHTARAYSDSPIFLAAYVTADDVRSNRVDAGGVAEELVLEMGGYLASRGVEPDRITGKGMGIDPAIGRAVVIWFGITPAPSEFDPRLLQAIRMDGSPYGL